MLLGCDTTVHHADSKIQQDGNLLLSTGISTIIEQYWNFGRVGKYGIAMITTMVVLIKV